MKRKHIAKLSQRDAILLLDALEKPTKIQARLQKAAKNYMKKTQVHNQRMQP